MAVVSSLEKRFDSMESKLSSEIGSLCAEVKSEIDGLRTEVKTELSAIKYPAPRGGVFTPKGIKTNHFGHLKNYLGILNGALLDKRVIDNEIR